MKKSWLWNLILRRSWIASCPLLSCSLLWKMRCAMAWIKGEDAAVIAVTDHGSGIPDEVVRSLKAGQGKGVGLLNVHKRLQSLYGEEGGLQITVTENGSRVAFRIPLGKIEDLGEPAAISAQGRAV